MAGDLKVLKALDAAKTQWYHFTAIIIAGMGFFTDAYDLFCISLVTKLLGRVYYHVDGSTKPGSLPPGVSAAVNGVAFCGTLTGRAGICRLHLLYSYRKSELNELLSFCSTQDFCN